jgi:hypothetical protein
LSFLKIAFHFSQSGFYFKTGCVKCSETKIRDSTVLVHNAGLIVKAFSGKKYGESAL